MLLWIPIGESLEDILNGLISVVCVLEYGIFGESEVRVRVVFYTSTPVVEVSKSVAVRRFRVRGVDLPSGSLSVLPFCWRFRGSWGRYTTVLELRMSILVGFLDPFFTVVCGYLSDEQTDLEDLE